MIRTDHPLIGPAAAYLQKQAPALASMAAKKSASAINQETLQKVIAIISKLPEFAKQNFDTKKTQEFAKLVWNKISSSHFVVDGVKAFASGFLGGMIRSKM